MEEVLARDSSRAEWEHDRNARFVVKLSEEDRTLLERISGLLNVSSQLHVGTYHERRAMSLALVWQVVAMLLSGCSEEKGPSPEQRDLAVALKFWKHEIKISKTGKEKLKWTGFGNVVKGLFYSVFGYKKKKKDDAGNDADEDEEEERQDEGENDAVLQELVDSLLEQAGMEPAELMPFPLFQANGNTLDADFARTANDAVRHHTVAVILAWIGQHQRMTPGHYRALREDKDWDCRMVLTHLVNQDLVITKVTKTSLPVFVPLEAGNKHVKLLPWTPDSHTGVFALKKATTKTNVESYKPCLALMINAKDGHFVLFEKSARGEFLRLVLQLASENLQDAEAVLVAFHNGAEKDAKTR